MGLQSDHYKSEKTIFKFVFILVEKCLILLAKNKSIIRNTTCSDSAVISSVLNLLFGCSSLVFMKLLLIELL